MSREATTQVTSEGKVLFPIEITEQLGVKNGDTFEVYADHENDKIYLVPRKINKESLSTYSSVTLNNEACISLPLELKDAFTLSENEELSVNIDVNKGCIILEPVSPTCVFCGELGDKALNGKYICPGCAEKISLGEE